ncbi:DUF3093 family protein [Streptomyces sp. NPDC051963]
MTSTSRLVHDERLAGMYVIPTPVRVEVLDPDDPTPYLYLGTRS